MSDLSLNELLRAIDKNVKELWPALNNDQQKELKKFFFNLPRYISSVKGKVSREHYEHFVLTTNEYVNKHWTLITNHPELMWQLMCMCNYDKKIFYHEWIKLVRKNTISAKIKTLANVYPNAKIDDLEVLAALYSDKDIKLLCKQHGLE